jgi:hypothetical protein
MPAVDLGAEGLTRLSMKLPERVLLFFSSWIPVV